MNNISIEALIRMGALIGIGVLINKNTFEGGHLFKRGTYWKEDAKSNHYGSCFMILSASLAHHKDRQSGGFIKGWAPGKLTSCDDDFAGLYVRVT